MRIKQNTYSPILPYNSTHTYEITCKLTRASFYIFVENGLQGINPIKLENINPLQTAQPVGTAYAYAYEYITFKVASS